MDSTPQGSSQPADNAPDTPGRRSNEELVREYKEAAQERNDAPPPPPPPPAAATYYEDYRDAPSQWPLPAGAPHDLEQGSDSPVAPAPWGNEDVPGRHATPPSPHRIPQHGLPPPRDPRHNYIPHPQRGHPHGRGAPYPRGAPPPHGHHPMMRGPGPVPPPPANWRGRDRPPPRGRPYPRGSHQYRPPPPPGHPHYGRPPPHHRQQHHPAGPYPPRGPPGRDSYQRGPPSRSQVRWSAYSESQYSASEMASKQTSPDLDQLGFPTVPIDGVAFSSNNSSRASLPRHESLKADATVPSPISEEYREANRNAEFEPDAVVSPVSPSGSVANRQSGMNQNENVRNSIKRRELPAGHSALAPPQSSTRENNLLSPGNDASLQGVPGILRTSASTNSLPSFKSASSADSINLVDGERLVNGQSTTESSRAPGSSDRLVDGSQGFSFAEPAKATTTESKQNLIATSPGAAKVAQNMRTPTLSVSLAPEMENEKSRGRSSILSGRNSRNSTRAQSGMFLSVPERTDARASTTSLPGLIRRALRLASNLEDGKTSSKVGTDWMKEEAAKEKKRGSLNSVLVSFPATPHRGSPGAEKGLRQLSEWPEEALRDISQQGQKKRGRRICSMPLWAFILVIVLIIGLVVAAVVIPVCLVVLPNNDKAHNNSGNGGSSPTTSGDPTSSTTGQNTSCDSPLACVNGGTNVAAGPSNACVCLCPNGFGGPTCSSTVQSGCAAYTPAKDEDGAGQSLTFGSSIPPLISASQPEFAIPLNASLLNSLFATGRTSCSTQNALVSFDNIATKVRRSPSPVASFVELAPRQSIATVNGLLIAVSTGIGSPTLLPDSSASDSTGPVAQVTALSSNGPADVNKSFLSTAILFILQTSQSIAEATSAQTILTSAILQSSSASSTGLRNITIPGGWTVDVSGWSINAGGVTVGGRGPADSSSS